MKNLFFAIIAVAALAGCGAGVQGPEKVVVFGDSYSTFEEYIPEGYESWYFEEMPYENDCHCVDSTWWRRVIADKGYELLLNTSYSGATICNVGYNGDDYTERSFSTRVHRDIVSEEGEYLCGGKPDIIFILAGTNDSWAQSPKGELLGKDDWREADLDKSLPAISYMLGYLTEKLPDTRIIVIINSELDETTTAGLAEASRIFGVESLQLKDIDKQWGHPSNAGMRQIAEQLEAIL